MDVRSASASLPWHKELRAELTRNVLTAAPLLLGCELATDDLRARIVEVEAYSDDNDPGCHAFYGRTARTEIMFGPAGFAYVYFSYGNHWMLNITAHEPGRGAAVLIRAAEPKDGLHEMARRRGVASAKSLLSGPGKLAQAFGVDKSFYGVDLLNPNSVLRIEPGESPLVVLSGPRIGLALGKGELLPWRFADGEKLRWVSAAKRSLQARQ